MFPVVTAVIILLNCAVYWGFQHAGVFSGPTNQTFVAHYSFIPYELSHQGKVCGNRAELGPDREVRTSPGGVFCEGRTTGEFVNPATGEHPVVHRVLDRHQPSVFVTIFTAMFMH